MPKLEPKFAFFFVFGGVLVAVGFYLLIKFADMEAGMSAGSVPSSPSIIPFIALFELYFLVGLVASLLPRIIVRRTLAVASHVALVSALLYVGLPLTNPISIFIWGTAIIYSYSWVIMIRRSSHAA